MNEPTVSISSAQIEEEQRSFNRQHSAVYLASPPDSKLGFALATKGLTPLNGLRHPAQGDTNGWYLWCGEEYSGESDFFQPLHARHVYEDYPQIVKLLGLPPGYRFLLAGDYLDVWYDASLLDV